MHYPDFLEIQLKSFHDFFQLDTTAENSSITISPRPAIP